MDNGTGLSQEQKQYLEAFLSGVAARQGAVLGPGSSAHAPADEPGAPDPHRAAQDRFIAQGKTLVPEERAKRERHPFEIWDDMNANAAAGRFPKGLDVFRHKFFGLFYSAPAEDAFMCRLRIPHGILSAHQARGVADIARKFGAGTIDITTRANLQLRGVGAQSAIAVLTAVQDLGLTSRGAGADNVRNITGSPLAGIDAHELVDTRPLARALHHHILNHRELYGLPRKFNIAFDGGGAAGVLADTNDIGFAAVEPAPGAAPSGVYFRMLLGGITGHGDFGRDAGILLTQEQCVAAAVAVLRVFIAHGDRTDRKRARLKYVLDAMGMEKVMAEVARELPFAPLRLPPEACLPRRPVEKHGHIGIHAQKQPGFSYIGVAVPVGRLDAAKLGALADIAEELGSGTLRLTVWQNLILSDIPEARLEAGRLRLAALGLASETSFVRGALVACTGNTGCKFSATDTKGQALIIADYLDNRVALDQPINIHLTGCPNSCAQVHVGDIGLLGLKVGDDMVEGYTILVGGGAGEERGLAREIFAKVPMPEVPHRLERVLKAYLAHRNAGESFADFTRRHSLDELKSLFA